MVSAATSNKLPTSGKPGGDGIGVVIVYSNISIASQLERFYLSGTSKMDHSWQGIYAAQNGWCKYFSDGRAGCVVVSTDVSGLLHYYSHPLQSGNLKAFMLMLAKLLPAVYFWQTARASAMSDSLAGTVYYMWTTG